MLPDLSLGTYVNLPTYFVFLSFNYSALIFVAWKWAQMRKVSELLTLNLSILLIFSGMLGGRLFHILYEAPQYYREYPIDILKFWQGGFVFYGGLITALAASSFYLYKKEEEFLPWADFFAPLLAVGYGLGRIACFLAGCCYGKSCSLPWAVDGRHPVQLYATLLELLFAAFLFWRSFSPQRKTGEVFFLWLLLHGLGRLWMESLRDDFRGKFVLGLSLSSWISLVLVGFAASALVRMRFANKA